MCWATFQIIYYKVLLLTLLQNLIGDKDRITVLPTNECIHKQMLTQLIAEWPYLK